MSEATQADNRPRKVKPPRKPRPRSIRSPLPAIKLGNIGRPTSYRPEIDELAYRLALLGLTDEEMASTIGVSVGRFYEWSKKYPSFNDARARGRDKADAEVAAKLYQRALGYSHEAVQIFAPKQEGGEPTYATFTKHYPPDTEAARWWLQNRQSKKWKDRVSVEHNGEVALVVAPETRRARIAELERKLLADGGPPTINEAGEPDESGAE